MTVPERYKLSFPVYRPVNEDDHFLNNRFVERIFNALPIPTLSHDSRTTNYFGLTVGDEVPDLSVSVPAVTGQQFVIHNSGLMGLSTSSTNNVPSAAGTRGHAGLYVYADGVETAVQRIADWTVATTTTTPSAAVTNQWKFDTTAYYKATSNTVLRFYWKVTLLSSGYAYVATLTTVPLTITVVSYGVG